MIRVGCISLAALLTLVAGWAAPSVQSPHRIFAAPITAAGCSTLTLQLRPGLNPSPPNALLRSAPDIPRGPFFVSLPVYPQATSLSAFVATPFPEYPADPYLQTASTEYRSVDDSNRVESWFDATLRSCGWHTDGTWNGNATAFTEGTTFVSNTNPKLSLEMSFGGTPSGGTYIGYGVEEVALPPRPACSFLHGPFVQLHIAFRHALSQNGQTVWRVVHRTVRARGVIDRLIRAVNAIKDYRMVLPLCSGGRLNPPGPAWLSFVRPNRSVVHAFETGPGDCNGLAVNGVRWLTDSGAVWSQVLALTGGRKQ